jgi:hypothetical protein
VETDMTKLCVVLFLSSMIIGCENHINEMEPCEELIIGEPTYSSQVYPIISRSCAIPGCHVSGFEKGDFTRFEEVKNKVDNGIFEFMIDTDQMPHGNTPGPKYLTVCEIVIIKNWIKNGAERD